MSTSDVCMSEPSRARCRRASQKAAKMGQIQVREQTAEETDLKEGAKEARVGIHQYLSGAFIC
jgi:hypothetical protein